MNDHTSLLDRLDQTPVTPAPIGEILGAGRAAKRRQRRAVIVGAAAATMLVLGGVVVFAHSFTAGGTATVSPADSAPPADNLTVRITSDVPSFANLHEGQPLSSEVRAKWDPDAHTLTYVSDVGYSSSCLPTGTATIDTDGAVELKIVDNFGAQGFGCTADAVRVAAVIEKLVAAPTTLSVTDGGATREVPFLVVTVGPALTEQFPDDPH